MFVRAGLLLNSCRDSFGHLRHIDLDWGIGLIVIAVGVSGLIAHSWLRTIVEPWMSIHLLFGLLLAGWLTLRMQLRVRQFPAMVQTDLDQMSRRLSRTVFFILYAVFGIRLSISLLTSAWGGGANDDGPWNERFRSGPGSVLFNPKDDYQMFLAFGLLAWAFVRFGVIRLRARIARAASQPH